MKESSGHRQRLNARDVEDMVSLPESSDTLLYFKLSHIRQVFKHIRQLIKHTRQVIKQLESSDTLLTNDAVLPFFPFTCARLFAQSYNGGKEVEP